jgi:ABC-type sugar transport system substrate-binding protein
MVWRLQLLVVFVVCALLSANVSARDVQVAFINPGAENSTDVWQPITRFMAAAAEQFGLKLEVLYANRDRIRMVELARAVASRTNPPDYVVLVNEKQRAPEMMEFFRGHPSRLLLMHNDLTPEQRREMGNEREALVNWIGTITHEVDAIPTAMMDGLYRKSAAPPRIVGISGDRATPISALGERAVRAYIARAGRGELLQVVPGNWERADAASKVRGLLQRYPNANMVWAANDTMALGALDTVVEMNLKDKVLVGGMGAFPQALQSVAAGNLAITAGSPVFIGAWCMVMIHDYQSGKDFASAGGPRQVNNTAVVVSDAASAARLGGLMERPSRIDFRRFSLAENSGFRTYDFSYEAVVAATR